MEKILLIQNAHNANTGTLDFACYMASLTNSRITGVFLDNAEDESRFVEQKLETAVANPWPVSKPVERILQNIKITNDNISSFKQACETRSTRYAVHVDKGNPIEEIIRESRYADLLVVDAEITSKSHVEAIPSSFLSHILKGIECPAIVAPQSFEGTEQIIFTYDGSKSSVFAIKQFCYLLPQFDEKKVTVLQIDDGCLAPAEDLEHLKEWLSVHYSSIGFATLKGDSETELLACLIKKENSIVVMGSYGKANLTARFSGSHADRLIKVLNQPIFIAHQ